jgi:hypothetical protein
MPKHLDEYSYRGSHVIDGLRIYHQGGLDTYGGFYAILNLVNFLKLKELKLKQLKPKQDSQRFDFLRQPPYDDEPFGPFRRFIDCGGFRGFFPPRPFGDNGLEPPMLRDALSRALSLFYLPGSPNNIEDQKDPYDDRNPDQNDYFRNGTEAPFATDAKGVLGLAAVKEDKDDVLGHWVVLIGKGRLEGTPIQCENEWDGIVLDSDRGYERWRYGMHSKKKDKKCLIIKSERQAEAIDLDWIYSYISLAKRRRSSEEDEPSPVGVTAVKARAVESARIQKSR